MSDNALHSNRETIVAVATAPGRGGIGVVRISGDTAQAIAQKLTGAQTNPRQARLANFLDSTGDTIDRGIVLFYQSPASYTGEDVVELQAHGSPVLLDALVQRIIALGARAARAGEFTERAFLNGKLDLAQAEAVADLINARTLAVARAANRSLAGDFSIAVGQIVEALIQLRIRTEAAIDFPEEQLDLPALSRMTEALGRVREDLNALLREAAQTVVLTEGLRVVLAGEPNVGKSSLMNRLLGDDRVIVSDTPGTTRDVVVEQTAFNGIPVTLTDTAGLRETTDAIESAGVQRAQREIDMADVVLLVEDDSVITPATHEPIELQSPLIRVLNKIDQSGRNPGHVACDESRVETAVAISALTGAGVEVLTQKVSQLAGHQNVQEARFVARRRHLASLEQAKEYLDRATKHLLDEQTLDLSAEDLRLAGQSLGEITGVVSSDELLGRIFADFCIGK